MKLIKIKRVGANSHAKKEAEKREARRVQKRD